MEEAGARKILTPRLIVLLVILAAGSVVALYLWLVYVPYMREFMDDESPIYEELNLDGDGEVQTPFLIRTAEDLAEIAEKVNNGSTYREKHFLLMNDIDMTGYLSPGSAGYNDGAGWKPIGSFDGNRGFGGVFDGAGYTVSGLWLNRPSEAYGGLFGSLQNASVFRLNVSTEKIVARHGIGALAGNMTGGIIQSCIVIAEEFIIDDEFNGALGILVGWAEGENIIDNSFARGSVNIIASNGRFFHIGGLVGVVYDGVVSNSYADADITIRTQDATINSGGLIGLLRENTVVINCHSTGSVIIQETLISNMGGLIGRSVGENIEIRNSSSSADVSGTDYLGGFIGVLNEGTEISGSFSTGNVTCADEIFCYCLLGGFVGYSSGTIRSSFAAGDVTMNSCSFSGGFVGYQTTGIITDCYSTGDVISGVGFFYYGGFAGGQSEESRIENCYSTGKAKINGFIPSYNGIVKNCYYDSESSDAWSFLDGVTGKPTAEMQNIITFEGWDFTNIWFMPENDYPKLRIIQ
ncbi:MAG: hypothetical protein LBC82_06245 [Oscillospiraceae bacterium]|jgi:hypothetical protein|nr:hypothetical protein [Oscillospiraceae bacterium]